MSLQSRCMTWKSASATVFGRPLHLSARRRTFPPGPGSPSRKRRHGSSEQAKRSAIRPITLFAACIPLGYAVHWALRSAEDAADADGFVKYTLADKEAVSSTSSIFTLRPAVSPAVRTDDPLARRVVTSVQFKQPQLQIARSYTLLPSAPERDAHELRFLIRRERNGEVSGYLHSLPLGAELELRGLTAEYLLPEKVDAVLFLAGGTGIAPAMQVADALSGEADVHVLWASRKREDCAGGVSDTDVVKGWSWRGLLALSSSTEREPKSPDDDRSTVVAELERLKQHSSPAGKLSVDYYVDEEGTFIQPQHVSRLLRQVSTEGKKNILFVAGPDGFVNHWAATKLWINGREVQGPLGGVLASMDLRGWEVVKL